MTFQDFQHKVFGEILNGVTLDNCVMPSFFVGKVTGRFSKVPIDDFMMANSRTKEAAVNAIRFVVKLNNADYCGFISEAWFAQMEKDEIKVNPDGSLEYGDDFVPASKRPDRQEGVVVVMETRTGERVDAAYPIIREGKEISLGDNFMGEGDGTGRVTFSNFFEEPPEF